MLLRLGVVVAVMTVTVLLGLLWNHRDGRVRTGAGRFSAQHLDAVGLNRVGRDGAALLLGSPTCSPCVTVKAILAEVADERPGFDWVYADAADHLDLADDHHVMRVPTLFLIDRRRNIIARTSGVPAKRDLLRALDREGQLDAAA